MRLLLARHGESEANVARVIANRDTTSYPLTAAGRHQAEGLAAALGAERVARILTSPLLRAIQTAEVVGRALSLPVEIADALREFDCGIYEGRSDVEAWRAHAAVQADWLDRGRPAAHLPGGESLLEIRARFVPFVAELVATAAADTDVMLVGHGGLYRVVLPALVAGLDPLDVMNWTLDHARWMTVAPHATGRLVIERWPT